MPESGRSPGGGNGNPFQYSCLENSVDRGAWCATVHGVTKRWTRLSNWAHTHTHTRVSYRQMLPRHETRPEYANERCGKLPFAGYLLHAKRCAKHFIYASACFDKSLEYSCKVSILSPFYSEEGMKAEKIDDSHQGHTQLIRSTVTVWTRLSNSTSSHELYFLPPERLQGGSAVLCGEELNGSAAQFGEDLTNTDREPAVCKQSGFLTTKELLEKCQQQKTTQPAGSPSARHPYRAEAGWDRRGGFVPRQESEAAFSFWMGCSQCNDPLAFSLCSPGSCWDSRGDL